MIFYLIFRYWDVCNKETLNLKLEGYFYINGNDNSESFFLHLIAFSTISVACKKNGDSTNKFNLLIKTLFFSIFYYSFF